MNEVNDATGTVNCVTEVIYDVNEETFGSKITGLALVCIFSNRHYRVLQVPLQSLTTHYFEFFGVDNISN